MIDKLLGHGRGAARQRGGPPVCAAEFLSGAEQGLPKLASRFAREHAWLAGALHGPVRGYPYAATTSLRCVLPLRRYNEAAEICRTNASYVKACKDFFASSKITSNGFLASFAISLVNSARLALAGCRPPLELPSIAVSTIVFTPSTSTK